MSWGRQWLAQKEGVAEVYTELAPYKKPKTEINQTLPFSNPVQVTLPDCPVNTHGACITTREKELRIRTAETEALVEHAKLAGEHATVLKELNTIPVEQQRVFARFMWQNYAPSTLRGARQALERHIKWHSKHGQGEVWPITTEKVQAYLANKIEEGCEFSVPEAIV